MSHKYALAQKKGKKKDLSIKNLNLLNRALLEKQIWRFTLKENAAWRNYIGLNMVLMRMISSINTTEEVMRLAFENRFQRSLSFFKQNSSLKLGNENKIRL